MQRLDYCVSDAYDGVRLDVFLTAMLDTMSRSAVARLLDTGAVTLDNMPCKKNRKVSEGEEYSVTLPELTELCVEAENIPLDIVYEDADVLVLNKPKGMVVHPAPGNHSGTLVNALLYYCKDELSGIGGVIRPGIVHRIDKDTSGLLAVAKNDTAHLGLSAQLADHSMYRIYYAIVIGTPGTTDETGKGVVNAPIGRSASDRKKMAVTDKGKNAVTHFTILKQFNGYSLLECRLETGRTHQIRVHMAHIGHPILGDEVYGGKRQGFDTSGQCLHAKTLCFTHPITKELVEVTSPLPKYFQSVLTKLEKSCIV